MNNVGNTMSVTHGNRSSKVRFSSNAPNYLSIYHSKQSGFQLRVQNDAEVSASDTIQNEFDSSNIGTRRKEYENVQFAKTVGAVLNELLFNK